jgi:hypothetical protein
MFKRLRRRVTYANVAMTLALVFAMSGGAYAAGKYLITSTKQIKPSVLASLKGKAGPAGKEGPAGAAGKEGSAGKEGAPGKEGKAGANGVNGANGESVTSAALKAGEEGCAEGGSKFTVAGKTTTACGGVRGPKGPEGSPWTLKGVLPSEATETGTWAADGAAGTSQLLYTILAPISFTIPLKTAPKVTIIESGNGAGGGTCPTTSSEAKPEAEAGNLCIFVVPSGNGKANVTEVVTLSPAGALGTDEAGTTGTVVAVVPQNDTEPASAYGTWAVTAE